MDLLNAAIVLLEAEITQLQALYNKQNVGSDIYWWTLQAKSLGLSHLQTLRSQGLTDPIQADQVRKLYRKELQPAAQSVAEASAR